MEHTPSLPPRLRRHLSTLRILAEEAEGVKSRVHVAGIVHRKWLIASGTNRRKTHPLMSRFGKTEDCVVVHAEIDAIAEALSFTRQSVFQECALLSLRWHESGWKNATPCAGCWEAIRYYKFPEVWASAEDGFYRWQLT